jgi:hypothetical protein
MTTYNLQIVTLIRYLFILTVSLSPVFRLPLISFEIISWSKFLIMGAWLYSLCVFLLISKKHILKRRVFKENSGIFLVLLIMTIYIIMSILNVKDGHLLFAKSSHFVQALYSLILIFMTILTTSIILNHKMNLFKFLSVAAYFISILCFIHISIVLLSLDSHMFTNFHYSAFSRALKTNWSNSIALFTIIIPVHAVLSGKSKFKVFLSLMYGSFPILASQMISGGRAGVIASFLSILMFVYYSLPRKYIFLYFIFIFIFYFFQSDAMHFLSRTYYTIIGVDTYGFDVVNNLSSQRLFHWIYALDEISNSPLFGSGLGNGIVYNTGTNNDGLTIHNVFLRKGMELGVPFMILMSAPLFMVGYRYFKIRFLFKLNSNAHEFYSIVIMCSALFISLLEPSYIWSGLGQSWIFWIMYSFFIFHVEEKNKKYSKQRIQIK